jgi:hypothetical protein
MLSVGPGAARFSPSQNICLKSTLRFGNVHYRHRPLDKLTIKTGERLTEAGWFVFLLAGMRRR